MAHYPPPNNPKVCKVTMLYKRDTRVFANTFYVANTADWNAISMASLNGAVRTVWWATSFRATVPSGIALTQIQYRKMSPTDPLALDVNVSPAEAGTAAGTMESGQTTLTISWRTGLAGKAFRGRIYIPGLVESVVNSDDTASSVIVSPLATSAATLMVTLNGSGYQLVVFHRPGLVPKSLDNSFNVVTSAIVENIIDSQRRRLPGRGR